MDKELYDLLDNMTADELMPADGLLEDMAENTSLPEDVSSRIRASVLQKAGFEMKNTIRMNKGKNNSIVTENEELNTVRRGHHIVAACAALAVAAAAVGSIMFGSRLEAENPASPVSETAEITSVPEITDSPEETEISQTEDDPAPMTAEEELPFVPNVKDLSEEEAQKTLSDAGFVPVIRKVWSEDPEGKVVNTSPMAGEQLEKGSEVECFVSLGYLNGDSILPEVWGESEEAAEQKLREAGFVPEKVEMFSIYDVKGTVMTLEYDPYADELPPFGSKIKYYVSSGELQPDSYEEMPDYNKVVYEDDELRVTADKLLCDGNYFIMHLKEETKDGTPVSEIHKNWGERLRFAEDGERVAYIKGYSEDIYPEDSSVGGAYLAWALDFMTEGKELTVDLVSTEDNVTYKSETRSENVTRDSFTLKTNIPTRTLTSEDGISLTLSPMGISWSDGEKWVTKAEGAKDPFMEGDQNSGYYIVTKDGQSMRPLDFYLSAAFDVYTESVNGYAYYAYKDIDEIDHVELGGVIYK